jgi:hypothetical protein
MRAGLVSINSSMLHVHPRRRNSPISASRVVVFICGIAAGDAGRKRR